MTRIIACFGFMVAAALVGLCLADTKAGGRNDASTSSSAADEAAVPKFSTIASAEDLSSELNFFIADLDKAVVDEDEYKAQIEDRFLRDANTIALVATALALHDQDNAVKPHAQAIIAAAHKLGEAKDFAATKAAVADLKASLQGGAAGPEKEGAVKWSKIAALKNLMKDEVPNVNVKLKNSIRRLDKRAKEAAGHAATMALIAENAKLYVADTKKPNETAKWAAFSEQFRAAAADVAVKAHAGDKNGASAAMEKLNQSCHDCHAVFNPEAKE
jgi:cytochrome c556